MNIPDDLEVAIERCHRDYLELKKLREELVRGQIHPEQYWMISEACKKCEQSVFELRRAFKKSNSR